MAKIPYYDVYLEHNKIDLQIMKRLKLVECNEGKFMLSKLHMNKGIEIPLRQLSKQLSPSTLS